MDCLAGERGPDGRRRKQSGRLNLRFACLFGLAVAAAACGTPAEAQVHETRTARHVLRASVVPGEALPSEVLQRHGIDAGSNRALLNVVVLEPGSRTTGGVPARVEVNAQLLAGYDLDIEMRPIVENNEVSYLGSFSIPPQVSAVRFSISASRRMASR